MEEERRSLVDLLPWFKLEDGEVGVVQLADFELRRGLGGSNGEPWRVLQGFTGEKREWK